MDSSEAEAVPVALDVTLHIPMDQLLGAYTERVGRLYNGPDEDREPPNILLDAIGERVAQMLLAKFETDARTLVRSKVDAVLNERISAICDEALTREFQPLNAYGEPNGPRTTVRGLVIKIAHEWFGKEVGSYHERQTQGAKYIADAVNKALKEDLDEALKQARAQITQQLRDKAAAAIAATIGKMSGVL